MNRSPRRFFAPASASLCMVALAATLAVGCSTPTGGPSSGGGGASGASGGGTSGLPGDQCKLPADCQSAMCTAGICTSTTSNDGTKNGNETDVDCGGAGAPVCIAGKQCKQPADCQSRNCVNNLCVASTNSDGIRNGDETGVDCGGPSTTTARCAPDADCALATDCASKVCKSNKCAAPSNTDAVQNGDESDVDCGGAKGPGCVDGKACKVSADCTSLSCNKLVCVPPSANDNIKNGTETGVDCGGPGVIPRCATGGGCGTATDCLSKVCKTNLCAAPSPTDGVQNGDESDVDCGGSAAPKCVTGKICSANADCASDGCAYDNRCASNRSCTRLAGGYTCGANDGLGRQSDCCETAAVAAYTIDKYQITAGRMRTFVERYNGNIRAWAQNLPAASGWNQVWTPELPASIDEANAQLGPYYDKRACSSGYSTGHTYWTPAPLDFQQDYPQNVLDTKSLNCTPWWLTKALCTFSGGHMITAAELRAAYTNNATTTYPWGANGGYTTNSQNQFANQFYSYATPNPPAGVRVSNGNFLDMVYHIAPPGRRPLGNNAAGIADLVGNLLEWVGDEDRRFVWKGSFEQHSREADNINGGVNDQNPYLDLTGAGATWVWGKNIGIGRPGDGRGVGYYGLGSRCAY